MIALSLETKIQSTYNETFQIAHSREILCLETFQYYLYDERYNVNMSILV